MVAGGKRYFMTFPGSHPLNSRAISSVGFDDAVDRFAGAVGSARVSKWARIAAFHGLSVRPGRETSGIGQVGTMWSTR
jgi:hypothetical protein